MAFLSVPAAFSGGVPGTGTLRLFRHRVYRRPSAFAPRRLRWAGTLRPPAPPLAIRSVLTGHRPILERRTIFYFCVAVQYKRRVVCDEMMFVLFVMWLVEFFDTIPPVTRSQLERRFQRHTRRTDGIEGLGSPS